MFIDSVIKHDLTPIERERKGKENDIEKSTETLGCLTKWKS